MVARARSVIVQRTRTRRLNLYTEGLKTKLKQSLFALSCLDTFSDKSDSTTSVTTGADFAISEQVCFYCDSFWAFLYSGLDVLGQIINQALRLGLDERGVSIKEVKRLVDVNYPQSALQGILTKCIKSNSFKNLERYRNCCLHRRHIYMEEVTQTVRGTLGYYSTSAVSQTVIIRVLCDNPLTPSTSTKQRRNAPEYMERVQANIFAYIERILREIQPVS